MADDVKELLRTTDPIRLSYAVSLLEGADVPHLVADQHISAVEGSIGVFPRRILVPEEVLAEAQSALIPLYQAEREAERAAGLRPGSAMGRADDT
mgnify:CR=1 FL=1|jgi:hypothetical protein